MKKETTKYDVELSQEVSKFINETKRGTNLSESDVIKLIVEQYFASKR